MEKMDDDAYMQRALELAKKGWGNTAPNPMVGAVLVKGGRIIGEGFHERDGAPHAERACLANATEDPKGATMYVTLEPCSTHGRTGACTDAIIGAKIAEVKIGALDPNPAHAGRAPQILRDRGIACETGILERECERLNFIFNYSIRERKALVAIKYAMSADGKIAVIPGEQASITGDEARADVMKWRRLFSAIGVGSGTLLADNPALTSRGYIEKEHAGMRVIFDASLRLAECDNLKEYKVFSDEFSRSTRIICDVLAQHSRFLKLAEQNIKVSQMHYEKADAEDFWNEVKSRMFLAGISSLYIEGGAEIFESVCKARAAEFAFEYVAPKIIGDGGLPAFKNGKNFSIEPWEERRLGEDSLTFGKIAWTR